MIARDWQDVPASTVAAIRDEDLAFWRSALSWDATVAWERIVSARAAGLLPGLVVEDPERHVVGWCFYLMHRGSLQVGALVGAHPRVTDLLLDRILEASDAATASSVVVFAPARAAGAELALVDRSFAVERYRYLQRALTSPASPSPRIGRPWHTADRQRLAALFARAYAGEDPARPFARSGTVEDWNEYVAQLVDTQGCGAFLPELSVVVPSTDERRLDGATIVTRLSSSVAHIAQCVVDPSIAGAGLGGRMMDDVHAGLARAGFTRLTLLVAGGNMRAQALYQHLGFAEAAGFVSAICDQPRRLTSAALDTGGARTLR